MADVRSDLFPVGQPVAAVGAPPPRRISPASCRLVRESLATAPVWVAFWGCISFFLTGQSPIAAAGPGVPLQKAPQATAISIRSLKCPAKFITSLVWDPLRDAVLAGTEGQQIFEYCPWTPNGRWMHFGKHEGIRDSCFYAAAYDRSGRVWFGSLRHGVDVFNGNRWQQYSLVSGRRRHTLSGPISEHVTSIAVDPLDNSVWMAGNSGLAIYHPKCGAAPWSYFTTANGLPSNALSAIAFGPQRYYQKLWMEANQAACFLTPFSNWIPANTSAISSEPLSL